MKISSKINRLISFMLVIMMLFTSVPIQDIFAAEKDDYLEELQAMAVDAIATGVEETVESATEVVLDAIMPDSAGKWGTAIFGDGLPWNFFHNQVQQHIREKCKDKGFRKKELTIKRLSGKMGRADLYVIKNKKNYLWEVKPSSYKHDPNHQSGIDQLEEYVTGTANNGLANEWGPKSGIKIEPDKFEAENYTIWYQETGDGLVL